VSRARAAVLAIDGGNSKVDLALVSRSGQLLALLTGPTISHQQVPMEVATTRLAELNARAAREAGVAPPSSVGVFCVAGADFPADVRALIGSFSEAGVAERVSVHNDAFAALRAGAP
jgi:N-acetylglucosamine kinase-like BadF-type ATPase